MVSWKSKNVKDDGSCFYRALYNSAKNYITGSLVEHIYDCFGRLYLIEADGEDEFVEMMRDSLANRIENDFYDIMVSKQRNNLRSNRGINSTNARNAQIEGTLGLYETLLNWATAEDKEMYNLIISELPREFEEKFKKPESIVRISKDDFYKVVASLIRQKKVYASEYDISVVKFILEKCDNPIFLNMIHSEAECIRKKNELRAINVQRINENHYISWIEDGSNSSNNNGKRNQVTLKNSIKKRVKVNCDNFIERSNSKNNSAGFSVRNIDLIIHSSESSPNNDPTGKIHIMHQENIIEIIKGCEKEIFNDPNVSYPGRIYFNGKTGTMSNILVSGFFILYDYLMDDKFDIEINAEADFKILFNHIKSFKLNQSNEVVMPKKEFDAFKRIFKMLQKKNKNNLFKVDWFDNLINFFIEEHERALVEYPFYKNKSNSQKTLELLTKWGKFNKNATIYKEYYNIIDKYALYEYTPPYLETQKVQAFTDETIPFYYFLQSLYNDIDSIKSVEPLRSGGNRKTRRMKHKNL